MAVEVFRFFAEIPTPIKSDKNQPIEPKLSDSQKNSSSTIEDVMAELRNLKMLVDEGILTEEEFQQKKRQIASIGLIKKS
nr:SHOCT domain-containing protein [Enterococcus faecalis]